jgi:hypothetical protein
MAIRAASPTRHSLPHADHAQRAIVPTLSGFRNKNTRLAKPTTFSVLCAAFSEQDSPGGDGVSVPSVILSLLLPSSAGTLHGTTLSNSGCFVRREERPEVRMGTKVTIRRGNFGGAIAVELVKRT